MERTFVNGRLVDEEPLLLFISGDKSQVGKSSVCLGLMASLLDFYPASSLAYIKPATQCEKQQPVTAFCKEYGIDFVEERLSPVIFFAGFTRAFLNHETDSSATMLENIKNAVSNLGRGKKVILVDGVGYPAVGSICGVSNADVARVLNAPVLLVCRSGVGDTVDSFNLNATFFEHHQVHVLGAIVNRCATTGFYSIDKIEPCIRQYFDSAKPTQTPLGFLPEMEAPINANEFINCFKERVNVGDLLKRALLKRKRQEPAGTSGEFSQRKISKTSNSSAQVRRREDIVRSAQSVGASGG